MSLLLEKLAELFVGQLVKIPALGSHLINYVVLPLISIFLACHYFPEKISDIFDRTSLLVKRAALGSIGMFVLFALLTTPTPQPAGHGPVIGIIAVPERDAPFVYREDSVPPPDRRATKQPADKTPAPQRVAPRNVPLAVAENLYLPVDGLINQLPEQTVPEFDKAPHKTVVVVVPVAPSNFRIVQQH